MNAGSSPPIVLSPLSGEPARPEASFPTALLINGYAEKGIDVRRFFAGLDSITLYSCPATGYRFYDPPSLAGDTEFYAALSAFSWYYSPIRWEHEYAATLLSPGMRICEIGCGQGSFLESASRAGCVCTGLDINEKAAAKALERGLDVQTSSLRDHAARNQSAYDAVLAFEVLEHIYDVRSFFHSALSMLRPGGKLVLSMPNNDAFSYHFDAVQLLNRPPHHMGLWNYRALLALGRFFPLRVDTLEFEPLSHFKPQWIDALLRARLIKKYGELWKNLPEDAWELCAAPAREWHPFLHGPSMVAGFIRL